MCYSVLNLSEYPDNGADVSRILGIADVFQPQQIVSALIAVLHFGIVGFDALRPMGELVVFARPRIGKPEKVVLVSADRRLEPSGFKNRLGQHYLRVFDTVPPYLFNEIRNRQLRQITVMPAIRPGFAHCARIAEYRVVIIHLITVRFAFLQRLDIGNYFFFNDFIRLDKIVTHNGAILSDGMELGH